MEPIMQGFLKKQQQQRDRDKNQLPSSKSTGHGDLNTDGQNPPVEKDSQQAEFVKGAGKEFVCPKVVDDIDDDRHAEKDDTHRDSGQQ